jgi:hypothetical protein
MAAPQIAAGALGLVGVGIKLYTSIKTYESMRTQASEDAAHATQMREKLTQLENSRQDVTNPFANLGVATQAAEMQIEQTDIALANTLDAIRATGAAAGGATALAQAALQSKKDVSANIEQQESQNEKLRAEGELYAFNARERREEGQLDRQAALTDQANAQERATKNNQILAQQAMGDLAAEGLMGGAYGLSSIQPKKK